MTTLAALRQPPRRPTPAIFVARAERLQTIRAIGLNADIAARSIGAEGDRLQPAGQLTVARG